MTVFDRIAQSQKANREGTLADYLKFLGELDPQNPTEEQAIQLADYMHALKKDTAQAEKDRQRVLHVVRDVERVYGLSRHTPA